MTLQPGIVSGVVENRVRWVVAYWDRVGAGGVYASSPDSPEMARQLREAEEAHRADIRQQMLATD